jgi:outer membrane receptor protein involved in Fe transport
MKRSIISIIAFMLLLLNVGYVRCEEVSLKTKLAEEFRWLREEADIKITGVSKYEQRLTDVPAMVSVLSLSDLSEQTKSNVPELLRNIPGVTVYRNQGDSPWYRVSLRGLNDNFMSARTLVTIDGVPFFHPHGGGIDMSWLPIANIERIEVIKGTFSTLYGANAFGGVVNIVSKKGNPDAECQAEAVIQGIGRKNIDDSSDVGFGVTGMTAFTGHVGSVSYHLSADILSDQGYRQNWQVTPTFMKPQTRIGVLKDDLEQDRSRFSWRADTQSGLSFSGFYTDDKKDILGMNDDLDDRILHSVVSFGKSLNERYKYLVSLYYNRFEQIQDATESYRFPENKPYPGAQLVTQPFFYNLLSSTIGGEFRNDFRYSDSFRMIFGADFRYDDSELGVSYRDSDGKIKPFGYPDKDAQDYGAYVQAEYRQNKFIITPGVRYDYDSQSGGFLSGKLGIVYLIDDHHSVYGVAGRGFRAPNFNERFVNLFGKTGSEDLKPETTWQYEIGNKNSFFRNRLLWNLCAFYTLTGDYIAENTKKVYINTEGVTVWGAETDLTWQISSDVRAVAAYSAIIGERDQTGEDITRVPKHKWSVGLSYDDRKERSAKLTVRGESDRILGETMRSYIETGSYEVVDLSLSQKIMIGKSRWTFTLFADNLFDRRYTEAWPGSVSEEGGRSEGITLGFRSFVKF